MATVSSGIRISESWRPGLKLEVGEILGDYNLMAELV